MHLDDLIKNTAQWLKGTGANSNIVMSTRVRLARNLALKPFPNKARKKDLTDILAAVETAMKEMGFFNAETVSALVRDHEEKHMDYSRNIWTLLIFTLWYDEYIRRPLAA